MPSLTGNTSIQQTTNNVSAENIAFLSALSTTTALATKDVLLPTFDSKAPIKDPTFTGTVSGVTASMVKASDNNTMENKLNTINSTIVDLVADTSELEAKLETKACKTDITGYMVKIQSQSDKENTITIDLKD